MSVSLQNLRKAAQLAPPIALSQKLAGIDTELWEQNDTIDQAVKALVEQGHLICCFMGMMQQLASIVKEAGLGGPLVDQIEAEAAKAQQVLMQV